MLVCEICQHDFANKFTLKRHMERIHDSWQSQAEEEKEGDGESGTESENDSSEEHEDGSSSENNSISDDTDSYTFAEVQAILRFYCQKYIE